MSIKYFGLSQAVNTTYALYATPEGKYASELVVIDVWVVVEQINGDGELYQEISGVCMRGTSIEPCCVQPSFMGYISNGEDETKYKAAVEKYNLTHG